MPSAGTSIHEDPEPLERKLTQRLNVGCGATPTPGWTNLDNSWTVRAAHNVALRTVFRLAGLMQGKEEYLRAVHAHDIRWADATREIPAADASVDVVYSSHMVEHLTRSEAQKFFAEALRVLSPGGTLRVAVPDLDYHVDLYREHGDANRFVEGLHMASQRPESTRAKLKQLLVGERQHHWMYNGVTLTQELAAAGFADVKAVPAGSTGILEPGQLDLAERAPESVFVEAVKP